MAWRRKAMEGSAKFRRAMARWRRQSWTRKRTPPKIGEAGAEERERVVAQQG